MVSDAKRIYRLLRLSSNDYFAGRMLGLDTFATKERNQYVKKLLGHYSEYICATSNIEMTASLSVISLLVLLCKQPQVKRVVDLGSGFSSFALRLFAESHSINVCSVDDNQAWLEKTRQFLDQHSLNTKELYTWDEFRSKEVEAFDLVFHDMGNMQTRIEAFSQVMTLGHNATYYIMDDVHKSKYRQQLKAKIEAGQKYQYISLEILTRDSIGRHSGLVMKRRS